MAKVTAIREELQFNKQIAGIINVLKAMAASEFSRLQKERKKFDEFDDYLQEFFQMLDVTDFHHPFLDDLNLPNNIVFITSDVGLLGELNIAVVNAAFKQFKKGDHMTIVGLQGIRYIEGITEAFQSFPGISDYVSFDEVVKLRDFLLKLVVEKKVGRTVIIYPHFISFAIQETQSFQLFPCWNLFPAQSGNRFQLKAETGSSSKRKQVPTQVPAQARVEEEEHLIVEPSVRRVMEYLVRVWVGNVLYHIFWESKLSEWSSRIIHLESSSDELERQEKKARFKYFRALHENSDKSIREIFASSMGVGRM